jgi:hypothetical protein
VTSALHLTTSSTSLLGTDNAQSIDGTISAVVGTLGVVLTLMSLVVATMTYLRKEARRPRRLDHVELESMEGKCLHAGSFIAVS